MADLTALNYAPTTRRWSKAAIACSLMGLLSLADTMYVAHYGLPPDLPLGLKWMVVGPAHLLAIAGLILSVIAIIGQRRGWWIAMAGLIINGALVALLVFLVFRRFHT